MNIFCPVVSHHLTKLLHQWQLHDNHIFIVPFMCNGLSDVVIGVCELLMGLQLATARIKLLSPSHIQARVPHNIVRTYIQLYCIARYVDQLSSANRLCVGDISSAQACNN